ncbi:hypothetical protein [Mesorhizobium sp. WSM3876]|uniref:hypothetical protein n=1 Tax=Mesorhizobium sp. WSM3876 TaxID=422277 RepID=UPI000BAEF788|nr:hypothetical protein [Mesorhizobium sp. WSM3876]PBB84570.1 hypothetical protein CK216_21840 [Mesorhizobium sp. WSM3876]TGS65558.1 hypothetical protein EN844_19385 [Mesorhizobium sp. M3A.F.Ca.ET.201.01.1.1]
MREQAITSRKDTRTRVTYAGKTSIRSDFDAKKFALLLLEKRGKRKTLAERERLQAAMEAKFATN